jgi:hypothetical protein
MTLSSSIQAYFDSLLARIPEAVVVPLMPVSYVEGHYNNCHDNAAKWAAEHAEYTVVRGWLLWPQAGYPYMLHAHSVVSRPCGLQDVTPLRDDGLHFLKHEGSDYDFLMLAKAFAQHIHFAP